MTDPAFRLFLSAILLLLLPGCKILPDKGSKAENTPAPTVGMPKEMKIPIGTIHHVDAEGGFVLIQSSRSNRIEPETEITAIGDSGEITSVLKVSEARKGNFLSADILNGIPASGQKVLMDYVPRPQANPFQGGPPIHPTGSEVQVLE